jgi:hypothetical protein
MALKMVHLVNCGVTIKKRKQLVVAVERKNFFKSTLEKFFIFIVDVFCQAEQQFPHFPH